MSIQAEELLDIEATHVVDLLTQQLANASLTWCKLVRSKSQKDAKKFIAAQDRMIKIAAKLVKARKASTRIARQLSRMYESRATYRRSLRS